MAYNFIDMYLFRFKAKRILKSWRFVHATCETVFFFIDDKFLFFFYFYSSSLSSDPQLTISIPSSKYFLASSNPASAELILSNDWTVTCVTHKQLFHNKYNEQRGKKTASSETSKCSNEAKSKKKKKKKITWSRFLT